MASWVVCSNDKKLFIMGKLPKSKLAHIIIHFRLLMAPEGKIHGINNFMDFTFGYYDYFK